MFRARVPRCTGSFITAGTPTRRDVRSAASAAPGSRHLRGTVDPVVSDSSRAIEGAPAKRGWFHRHRLRIVIWIAVLEGILIWATHGIHIVTIIVLGVIAFVSLRPRRSAAERPRPSLPRETRWFSGASRPGATLPVAGGYVLIGALTTLLVIFALAARGLLLLDRR